MKHYARCGCGLCAVIVGVYNGGPAELRREQRELREGGIRSSPTTVGGPNYTPTVLGGEMLRASQRLTHSLTESW